MAKDRYLMALAVTAGVLLFLAGVYALDRSGEDDEEIIIIDDENTENGNNPTESEGGGSPLSRAISGNVTVSTGFDS
jgi:hypothetical protein